MKHEFTVHVNERHMAKAWCLFLIRRRSRAFWLAVILGAAVVCHGLLASDRGWLWGAELSAVTVLLLTCALFPIVLRRKTREFLRRVQDGAVHFELTHENLRVSTASVSSEMQWELIAEVVTSPQVWLLVIRGSGGSVPLPPDQVPEEALGFLTEAVVSHGGKVDGKP